MVDRSKMKDAMIDYQSCKNRKPVANVNNTQDEKKSFMRNPKVFHTRRRVIQKASATSREHCCNRVDLLAAFCRDGACGFGSQSAVTQS